MSMIARAATRQLAARRIAGRGQVRFSSSHHDEVYKHIPFDYSNRAAFATKLSAYLVTGFAIPFVAAVYQLRKSGAGNA